MSIKLVYGPSPKYPAARVHTADEHLNRVAGMLQSDLDLPYIAREFARRVRAVVAGDLKPFQGSGNAYFCDVGVERSRVGLDVKDIPDAITVSTVDLLQAVEEWAEHLEKSRQWPEWALRGPSEK